jgi:hypothetical protein
MKTAIFWDVGLVRTDVSEDRVSSIFRVERIRELGMLAVTSRLNRSVKEQMQVACSSQTLVLTRPTQRHIPEYSTLHRHRHENLESYLTKDI